MVSQEMEDSTEQIFIHELIAYLKVEANHPTDLFRPFHFWHMDKVVATVLEYNWIYGRSYS